jgi:periplasmic protein TonB
MSSEVLPITFFEEDDRKLLLRWTAASVIVLATHIAIATACVFLSFFSSPTSDGIPVVLIELSATPSAPQATPNDIAPGPEMTEAQAKQQPKQSDEFSEVLPPTSDLTTTIIPPEKRETNQTPFAPRTTATPRLAEPTGQVAAAPAVGTSQAQPNIAETSWRGLLVAHLQKFKRYPKSAATRHEQGIVSLSFTIDRTGHVLARSIIKSSGFADLDQEALDMIQRAQPLPAFPPSMTQETRDFVLPVRFYLN